MEQSVARTPLAPPPRDEFRAELRRRFMTGELADHESFVTDERPGGRILRFLVPLIAAAAIVLVTILDSGERRWDARLLGTGEIEVAGIPLGTLDEARIGVEVSRGGPIKVGDTGLELELADELVLEIRPNTQLSLQRLPEPGSGGQIVIDIERGEAFLKTLEPDLEYRVTFMTDEAWVNLVGTALGVMVDDRGTCVCVSRGAVSVTDRTIERELVPVTSGNTLFIFAGNAMMAKEMEFGNELDHTDPLLDFTRR